jgi:hypothetical protein
MTRWPADKVERWPIDRLIPYARNARTHSPEQIGQIAASIREWVPPGENKIKPKRMNGNGTPPDIRRRLRADTRHLPRVEIATRPSRLAPLIPLPPLWSLFAGPLFSQRHCFF